MSQKSVALRELIGTALAAAIAEREKVVRDMPDILFDWPPWPYWNNDAAAKKASAKLGTLKTTLRSDLIWKLKQFKYPYDRDDPLGMRSKDPHTAYRYAQSEGILAMLTSEAILARIRFFYWTRFFEEFSADLGKMSEHGYPLVFHRGFMLQLATQWNQVAKLQTKYKIADQWFTDYRASILKQCLREAAIYFPEIQRIQFGMPLIPANKLRSPERKIMAQKDLVDDLYKELERRGHKSRKFCYFFTALICSSRQQIESDNELSPEPETIRTNVEGVTRSRKQGSGKIPEITV
jgi:hypothetical protein